MTEGQLEPLLLEMQTLSQKYALGKTARRKFENQLKDLQEQFSAQAIAERMKQEKRIGFYHGFFAALAFGAIIFVVIRIIMASALVGYWG